MRIHTEVISMRLDAVQSVGTINTQSVTQAQPTPEIVPDNSYVPVQKTQEGEPQSKQESARQEIANGKEVAAKNEQEIENENEKIRKAVSELNKKLDSHTEAVFGIHDKTNRVTIKMVDKDSKKVIKEFPPDKTLDMIAKVWELAGIMVDEKR